MCQPCPDGYFCTPVNLTASPYSGYKICPPGFYCPEGTGLDLKECVPGTYSNTSGLSSLSQCLDCPARKYCSEYHALTFTGDCAGGHYCVRGVDRPSPVENTTIYESNCTRVGQHTGIFTLLYSLFPFHCASLRILSCRHF